MQRLNSSSCPNLTAHAGVPQTLRLPGAAASGFTLVEMLVAVALVVIMMSMFAKVFQLAAGSIGTQRGIAENDQRARMLTTVILNDLGRRAIDPSDPTSKIVARSFKNVVPYDAGETAAPDAVEREGYLYYSENDINDDTDDVLQFTVKLPGTADNVYVGKTRQPPLYVLSTTGTTFANSNEPDHDDYNPIENYSSQSVAAEVSYFLRAGRLYRRVLLLRDQDPNLAGSNPFQPQNENGINYFDPNNDGTNPLPDPYVDNFWNDFDFSAFYSLDVSGNAAGAKFNDSTNSLDNQGPSGGQFPIANPRRRFGHDHASGQPREFVGASFIGRFTHQETSYFRFQYPHTIGTMGNPMTIGTLRVGTENVASDGIDSNGVVIWAGPDGNPGVPINAGVTSSDDDEVLDGPRQAEDLLLSNVHAFDVKLFDDALGRFVDVGHATAGGDYYQTPDVDDPSSDPQNRNQHLANGLTYGPLNPVNPGDPRNRVYDTWHPTIDIDGDLTDDPPPFRPVDGVSGLPKPLRAIQITIRYLDVSSNQLRQLTLQVSLLN